MLVTKWQVLSARQVYSYYLSYFCRWAVDKCHEVDKLLESAPIALQVSDRVHPVFIGCLQAHSFLEMQWLQNLRGPYRAGRCGTQHTQVFLSDSKWKLIGILSDPRNCCDLSIQLLTTWNVWMKSKQLEKGSGYLAVLHQFHHHSGRCTGRSQHELVSWASLIPFFVYICDFVTCIIYGGQPYREPKSCRDRFAKKTTKSRTTPIILFH